MNFLPNNHIRIILSLIFVTLTSASLAAGSDSLSLFQSFYTDEIPHFHIKTKLNLLIKQKSKKNSHAATITVSGADGRSQEYKIKIRTRGNNRNQICSIPPLKLDFKKRDLAAAGIKRDFDKLKLVVKCKSSDNYEDYVLKEYLTYKLYSTLTDVSFRVQLIKLTIEDVDRKHDSIETYAFIIESIEELAERHNGIQRQQIFLEEHIDPSTYDVMCLFEFMIGNADWHIFKEHNTKLLILREEGIVVAIPYDFDYAALVNTPYATPHTKLPIYHLSQRYYLGPCREADAYIPIFELFKEKQTEMLSIVEEFEPLSNKHRKSMLNYLDGFYKILDNPKARNTQIIKHCNRHIKVE